MTRRPRSFSGAFRLLALPLALALVAAGCASGGDDETTADPAPEERDAQVLDVPGDYGTIADAVDNAAPGDLIVIAGGVYHETVTVETPDITIRGEDRNDVVLDGEQSLENGIAVFSDGVAVENLTLRNYRGNGVLMSGDYGSGNPLAGFRVDHVTAHANGLYGIYAFGARGGTISNIHASGHPDAGVYVGQCFPCDTVVRNVTSTLNAVGVQATNAGGDLYVVESLLFENRVGVEITSSVTEQLYPQRSAAVAANTIYANSGQGAPLATEIFGVGIVVAGGRTNTIEGNVVEDNPTVGIILTLREEFLAESNRVEANVATGNGVDLAFVSSDGNTLNNCFTGNTFATSSPDAIERALNCAPERLNQTGSITFGTPPPDVDPSDVPPPPDQPNLDGDVRSIPDRPAATPSFPSTSDLVAPSR